MNILPRFFYVAFSRHTVVEVGIHFGDRKSLVISFLKEILECGRV
jgi:hypothetical protein